MFGSAASAAPTFGSPKGKMSFGGIRGASPEADLEDGEDDDAGDGAQRIGLSEGVISLDQVELLSLLTSCDA